MIYLKNDSSVSQRIFIPRNESGPSATGHTAALQSKDYEITENGLTIIHPDPGYDGISGGSISVYVASTGYTPTHLNVEQNGIYVATGDTVYTGVTVDVSSEINNQTKEITLSTADTYTTKEFGIDVTPDSGYTGLDKVTVRTDFRVRPSIHAGTFDQNGDYTLDSTSVGYQPNDYFKGYNFKINVDTASTYQDGYVSGYTSGVTHQKSLLETTAFTSNGIYTREDGWKSVTVEVPQTGGTGVLDTLNVTQNNTSYYPPQGVDGYSAVTVSIDESQVYQDGFNDGYLSGSTDGFSSGYTSGVTDGFASGYTSGVTHQKSLLATTAFTDNGSYMLADGWSAVTVNVDTASTYQAGYTSGYTDGIDYQKSQLSSTTITANGTYTRSDGWDSVTVNVPFVVTMTQAEYDALAVKDPNIIYLIKN